MRNFIKWVLKGSSIIVPIFLFYLFCVYHIEPYRMAICWNPITGEQRGDTIAGFHMSSPFEMVSEVDLKPIRVGITTSANAYNYKLVSFNGSQWKDFVKVEGFRYYWWANRFSFNSGYPDEYRGFADIMRGYAYSNVKYPFITTSDLDYSTPQ